MAINFIVMTSCINEPVDISDDTYIYRLIENTAYAKASQVKKNIIDYYTESNQPEKALKMIAAILPEYSKKDTISINYTHLLRNKAYSLANTGRYKEAPQGDYRRGPRRGRGHDPSGQQEDREDDPRHQGIAGGEGEDARGKSRASGIPGGPQQEEGAGEGGKDIRGSEKIDKCGKLAAGSIL